ncbi:unnamed protein product, partial [Ectocarpus sp. 4 AP-2014]
MGFVTNNMMLVIQFTRLLAMFVKPIMTSQGSTQSGRAIYRRLVARNIVCTVAVVLGYTITTAVVVLAVLAASPGNNQIALPFGLSSCLKSIKAGRNAGVVVSPLK